MTSTPIGNACSGRRASAPRALVVVVALGALVAACGGAASPTPAGSSGPGASVAVGPTVDQPTTGPIATPGGSIAAGDGVAAFQAATSALDALDSYAYSVEIRSNGAGGATHTLMSGVVVNRPTEASSLEQATINADGTKSGQSGIVLIGDQGWIRQGAETEAWSAVPASQASVFIEMFAGFRPEKMFGLYFAGLGSSFTNAGAETKNGVPSTHYQGDESVGALLSAIAGVQGQWASDVWIATDGGFLVHSEASAEAGAGTTGGGSFSIVVDISEVNAAGPVVPPG